MSVNDNNKALEYLKAGIDKFQSGQYAEAIKDYDEAIKLKPDYAQAYSNRGLVKFQN